MLLGIRENLLLGIRENVKIALNTVSNKMSMNWFETVLLEPIPHQTAPSILLQSTDNRPAENIAKRRTNTHSLVNFI